MTSKFNVKEINLQIESVEPFVNAQYSGFTIHWYSTIGFGEYMIYKEKDSDKWYGDSEYMDSGENKEFIAELMRIFIEKLTVL